MLLVLDPGRSDQHCGRHQGGDQGTQAKRRPAGMARRPGPPTMPLTEFQREVLAVTVGNRSEQSHFAGGLVLNAADDSP